MNPNPWVRRGLLTAAIGLAMVWLGLTFQLLAPLFTRAAVNEPKQQAKVPDYDYALWYPLALQDGRTKPFQTACVESARQITGRSHFETHDPVAVVLAWTLAGGVDWEEYPFILCEHRGLRGQILEHIPADQARENGKYISPAELRRSPGFDRLLGEIARKRKEIQGRAHLELATEHLKAEEVGRRLLLFDALCGRGVTRLLRNALVGDTFLDLSEYADIVDSSPDAALAKLEAEQAKVPDPFHLVALDTVSGSGWFSLSELRAMQRQPERWQHELSRRLREMPEAYLGPENRESLQRFQERLKSSRGRESLAELKLAMEERRDQRIAQFVAADGAGDRLQANVLFHKLLPSPQDQTRVQQVTARLPKGSGLVGGAAAPAVLEEIRAIRGQNDEAVLKRLADSMDRAEKHRLQDVELHMLQLDYLENLAPDLYQDALAAQPFPRVRIDAVLTAFAQVRSAYLSGKADDFDEASRAFFQLLTHTTEPSVASIPWELEFNRWQPFLWAWISMLTALVLLGVSLLSDGRLAKLVGGVGLLVYVISLTVQTIGFALRIAISGRAPVSNMYESVIFAAFMAAVFALILELIYRRGFIALTGAAVAALGLVLADQMPLALDPKISPIVPVLRTNYWLTVHVLTIVSSYAAGTLAWGLGNLTLALLAFGSTSRDTRKLLARYTYRALQIAVLLLATGTFLGGWWAAESWGRFWGWDPKEVGALIALVCYVIPLHARYLGWVQDFGLAVAAVLCYASILLSWYVVNFLVAAGLHTYGFGGGGGAWVLWACLLNIEWLLIATLCYHARSGEQKSEVSNQTLPASDL